MDLPIGEDEIRAVARHLAGLDAKYSPDRDDAWVEAKGESYAQLVRTFVMTNSQAESCVVHTRYGSYTLEPGRVIFGHPSGSDLRETIYPIQDRLDNLGFLPVARSGAD